MIGKIILLTLIVVMALYIIFLLTGELHPLIRKLPELLNILNTQGKTMLSQLFG